MVNRCGLVIQCNDEAAIPHMIRSNIGIKSLSFSRNAHTGYMKAVAMHECTAEHESWYTQST